jgi:hypothetical protein
MKISKALLARRANGALSRGPKTPEGKRRSSLNALRHGLLSKGVVLQNESEETFNIVLAQHHAKLRPADDVEACAVEEMVASAWRLRRLWSIETRLFDRAVAKSTETDEADRIADAFSTLAAGPELHLIDRYETHLHRIYQRSFQNLLLLRSCDSSDPDEVAAEPVVPDPIVPEPVVPEPVVIDPVVPDPVVIDPVVIDPVVPNSEVADAEVAHGAVPDTEIAGADVPNETPLIPTGDPATARNPKNQTNLDPAKPPVILEFLPPVKPAWLL